MMMMMINMALTATFL